MKINSKPPGKIRAAILTWLGFTPDYLGRVAASDETAGEAMSADAMLRLSAAWACVRLISETIATLPLSMYERTSEGKRVAPQHPLHFITHDQPNPDATASVFWEAAIASMLLRGAARAERLETGDRLVGLRFLHPDRIAPMTRYSDGRKGWNYKQDDGSIRFIPASKVWTLPGFSLDGVNGVSVVNYSANVMGGARAAERVANTTFVKGLHPTTAWLFPSTLKPTQREEAREAMRKLAGKINGGDPAILEAGMDVKTIGINPADAQLLESRAFSVEEICRWFRVPPFMVGHSEKSTSWGTGIEQQMIGFLTFTLGPWLRRIEQGISKDLLLPGERQRYYPKFNVEGLLRADSSGRAAFYTAMVNNGVLTRDEVRELEDREPMGGNAAVLTVQSAMTTLDSVGEVSDADNARAAIRAFLAHDDKPE